MKYFSFYLVVENLQLVHEIRLFPKVLYKIGDLKNFSKLQKKESSGGAGAPFLIKLQAGNLKLKVSVFIKMCS